MSNDFDPYYRWLGIPPEEQPPDHYRLLGLRPLESDPDVISNAADRQMNYVRTFQMGRHGEMAEKILNEVAVAKVCLCSAPQKAEYDRRLSERLAESQAASASAASSPAENAAPPDVVQAPPRRIMVSTAREVRLPGERSRKKSTGKASWQKTSTLVAVTIVVVLLLINGAIWAYQNYFKGDAAANQDSQQQPTTVAGVEVPAGEMPPGKNLLEELELSAAQIRGEWVREDGAVVSDRTPYATLQLPVTASGNYLLAIKARRISGSEALAITLPLGSARATVVLDGGQPNAKGSGLELVNGARFRDDNNPSRHVGKVLPGTDEVLIFCHVTPGSVRVDVNGRIMITWQGEAKDLSTYHNWDAPQKSGILLGTMRSSFRFESVVLVAEPQSVPASGEMK